MKISLLGSSKRPPVAMNKTSPLRRCGDQQGPGEFTRALLSPARALTGERRGFRGVSYSSSSTIIYGFVIDDSDLDDLNSLYDLSYSWEEKVCEAAGAIDWDAKQTALRAAGQVVRWGWLDEPDWALGLVLANGDWDRAEELGSLAVPNDADEKLRALAEFFGIKPKPAKMLMLSAGG